MRSRSILGSAGPLVVGRGLSAAIGVALPAVLARTLDQASYGTYKQLFLVAGLAQYALQLGLAQSLFFFVPRATSDAERRTWLAQTQAMMLGTGVLALAAGVVFAPLLAARFSNPELATLGLPLGLLALGLVASSPLEVGLTARGRPLASATALVVSDAARVAAMLIPIELGLGLHGLAWGAAGAALSRVVASIATCAGPGALALNGAHVRRQLSYALPFGAAMLLAIPQAQLHQLFVASHTEPHLFALYSVGCMQIPVVSLLYSPVSETMQVRLGALERSGETHRFGEVFAEASSRLARIFLPTCALLGAVASPGLQILYGPTYTESTSIFRIAVLSVAVASLPVDGVLRSRGRTRLLFAANVVKLALTWPAVAIGFALAGMEGAIAGHVAIEATNKLVLLGVIARDLRVPASTLLGGRRLLRDATLAGVVGLAAWGVVRIAPNAILRVAGGTVVAALLVLGDHLLRRKTASPGVLREAA